MKYFWYSIRSRMAIRKARRTGKPVRLPRSPYFKKGQTYPLDISILSIDKNDPEYIKMCEEWKKTFEKAPLPEWLIKRMEQSKPKKRLGIIGLLQRRWSKVN